MWWSYCAPFSTGLAPYTNLSSKSKFQTSRATRFITYHASGSFLATFLYAPILSALHNIIIFRSIPEAGLQPKSQWMDKRHAPYYQANLYQSRPPLTPYLVSTAQPLRTTLRTVLKTTGCVISTLFYNSMFHSRTRTSPICSL